MKVRKLFQAKDEAGNLHYIENLDRKKAKDMDFFCPHCSQKVKPRMGKKVTWHFSHIDKPCNRMTKSRQGEEKGTKEIWSYTKKFKVGVDFKMDKDSYQCEFCKKIQSKKYGIKWSDTIYLCRDCYRQLDSERIKELQWKSLL